MLVLLMNYGPSGASHKALVVKNLPAKAAHSGDSNLIPESGRSPGGGHGTPLQYSCPENPMDGGAWRASIHGVAESWTGLEAECVGPRILFFFFLPSVVVISNRVGFSLFFFFFFKIIGIF